MEQFCFRVIKSEASDAQPPCLWQCALNVEPKLYSCSAAKARAAAISSFSSRYARASFCAWASLEEADGDVHFLDGNRSISPIQKNRCSCSESVSSSTTWGLGV